jgi:2-polyprenyl-3-methyl-5-hydroxy-6-metoxy-1,4-benzoquinol methylase
MRKIAKTYSIEFLNLGYISDTESTDEDLEKLSQKAHYNLYKKALSLCPRYPELSKTHILDIGCGIGGGIRWLKE